MRPWGDSSVSKTFGSPVPMENLGMAVHTSNPSAGKAGTGGSWNSQANMVSWMNSTYPVSEDKVMSLASRLPLHTCTQSERDRLLSLWYFCSMVDLVTPNSYILSSTFSSWSFYFLIQSHVSYFSPRAEVAWLSLARRELVDFQALVTWSKMLAFEVPPRQHTEEVNLYLPNACLLLKPSLA